MLTDPKKAALAAQQYFHSLWIGHKIEDLRVEEVELSEDESFWSITLGFNRPADKVEDPLSEVLDAPRRKAAGRASQGTRGPARRAAECS